VALRDAVRFALKLCFDAEGEWAGGVAVAHCGVIPVPGKCFVFFGGAGAGGSAGAN
jgi:hypothetical protein